MDNLERIGILMWFWVILMLVFAFVNFMSNDQFLVEWGLCFGGCIGTAIAFLFVRDD